MGYMGKILRVDLSKGTVKDEPLDQSMAKDYIGGAGLASKILYDEVDPTVDPLSPENKIIFSTGPLTGTRSPCSGRYAVVFKSPLTDAFGEGHSGGYWPAELKFAGYDAIIIEGAAYKHAPVYLWIKDGKAELRDASALWGKNFWETTDMIQKELGDDKIKVAGIGRAGEKLVKMACVMNDDHRAGGRGGAGAVMGSKNLKAIAVRGTDRPKAVNQDAFDEAAKAATKVLREAEGLQGMRDLGTGSFVTALNGLGILPTRNFSAGQFEGFEKVSGEVIREKYLVKATACYGCPIACGRSTKIKEGKYAGSEGEGPEYEAHGVFGSFCGNSDMDSLIKAAYLCNDYGLDLISTGNTIAYAMECYEKDLINLGDTDGLRLSFGNSDAMVKLVEKIGERDGFGDILANGVKRLSEKLGSEAVNFAMHCKGLEAPMHEPRGAPSLGLAYATANIGATHMHPYTPIWDAFGVAFPDWGVTGPPADRFSTEGRASLVKAGQEFAMVVNSADICQFVYLFPFLGLIDTVKMINAATGFDLSVDDAFKIGERAHNLQRMFNVKAGFKRDTLPPRFLNEPFTSGPTAGHVVDLEPMLDEYYVLRGWDKDGAPSQNKLKELGLA
jgi:aldehyde:ferredoxin oxidoreductase